MKKLNLALKKIKIPKSKKVSFDTNNLDGSKIKNKSLKSLNKNDIISTSKKISPLKDKIKPFGKK